MLHYPKALNKFKNQKTRTKNTYIFVGPKNVGRKEDKWGEKRAEEQGKTRETAKKARTTTKKARQRGGKCVFSLKFVLFQCLTDLKSTTTCERE